MGLFGVAEILRNLENPPPDRRILEEKVTGLWISLAHARRRFPAILRGTAVGTLLGPLPGSGNTLSAFTAYALEKKISKHPERFGTGCIEGVAAPESANNASAQLGFVPLLTLGIPSGATTAIMLGILAMQGVTIGPLTMTKSPELFWGLIASMWIGNLMLVIINLPLIGIWVQMLKIPYRFLFPAILVFSAIGSYSLTSWTFDIYVLIFFGVFGYVMTKLGFQPINFMLGFVLGGQLELFFRRSMLLGRGDPSIFVNHRLSLFMLLLALVLAIMLRAAGAAQQAQERIRRGGGVRAGPTIHQLWPAWRVPRPLAGRG